MKVEELASSRAESSGTWQNKNLRLEERQNTEPVIGREGKIRMSVGKVATFLTEGQVIYNVKS